MAYSYFDIKVSRHFRESILSLIPSLIHHPDAAIYRRIYRCLVWQNYHQWGTPDDTSGIVFDAVTVSRLVGRSHRTGSFSALDWLKHFSRDVIRLDIKPHRYIEGQARVVRLHLPEAVVALQEDLSADADLVWWETGFPVTTVRARRLAREQEAALRLVADAVPTDHPALPLFSFLNAQPLNTLGKLLRKNWPTLISAYEAMPSTTLHEQARKSSVMKTLITLRGQATLIYAGSDRTPRLYAIGASIHQLPRALRRTALKGCIELDAKACQLAIVEKLWRLPALTRVLSGRKDVWRVLLEDIYPGEWRDYDSAKDMCKRGVYSIIFGMGITNLRDLLYAGDGNKTDGFGDHRSVEAFLSHPIVEELMAERKQQRSIVLQAGGAHNAFGSWISRDRNTPIRSVIAQVIQSYEVALMMSLLPVFQAERIRVVSFLHDGVSMWVVDKEEEQRIVRRLQACFAQAAADFGFYTALEVKIL